MAPLTVADEAPRIGRLRMWKKIIFSVSLLIGLGLFVFFIEKFGGFGKAFEAVKAVGPLGLTVAVLTAASTYFFPAIGWWILMRGEGMNVPVWTTIKANFMGFPINFIAPSAYLGAEPLKTFYIAHAHGEPKRKILATIIVGKYQEIGSLLFVMIVAAGIALWKINFSRPQMILLISALAFLILLFSITLYAFIGNHAPTVKLINFTAMILRGKGRRRLARLRTRAEEMEGLIHAAFTKRWKTFIAAQAVTMLSAVAILMRPWVYFYFSSDHQKLGVEYLCAIYLVTNLINVVPHVPGALGMLEGGIGGLFKLMKLPEHHATGFTLVTRIGDLSLILLGAWLIFHYNLQAMAKRVAKGEEPLRLKDAEGALGEPKGPATSA
jgi:uncharacterized protein (TIRG00374 family)